MRIASTSEVASVKASGTPMRSMTGCSAWCSAASEMAPRSTEQMVMPS